VLLGRLSFKAISNRFLLKEGIVGPLRVAKFVHRAEPICVYNLEIHG